MDGQAETAAVLAEAEAEMARATADAAVAQAEAEDYRTCLEEAQLAADHSAEQLQATQARAPPSPYSSPVDAAVPLILTAVSFIVHICASRPLSCLICSAHMCLVSSQLSHS